MAQVNTENTKKGRRGPFVRVRTSGSRKGFWARKDALTHTLHHKDEVGWTSRMYPDLWFSSFYTMMEYKEKRELESHLRNLCPYDSNSASENASENANSDGYVTDGYVSCEDEYAAPRIPVGY